MPNKSLLKRAKTDSYTAKPMKINTQWLKNATRSLGGNALETLQDIAPNIYSVSETSARLAKQVTRTGNAESIGQKISNNHYVSMGRTAIKNALKDLQQGNFDNSERNDFSSDDESTRYNFGDSGGEEDSGANQSPVFVNLEGIDNVDASINKQTKYQMKAAQATVDTMVATSSAMMAANQKNAEASINLLTNINSSLQSLVKYQNENMTKFIQASMTYYESVGKAKSESSGGDREINASDVFDKDGKFSVNKYGDLLKKNITNAIKESDIGLLGTMLDSMGDEFAKNPWKYITKAVMDKAIPGAIKAATESVDKTFGNFIGEYIMKQSENLKGKDNFLSRFLGKALDLNISRRDKFELGGRVTADQATFDGITRNAITSEIPKYLRESTAYLRKLVELNGGDPGKEVSNSNIYNRETGMFEKYGDYSRNLLDSINESVIKTFEDSDFGKSLSKVANADELGDRKEEFSEILKQFYLALEKDERQRIDITKKGDGSDINTIIKGLSGSDDIKKVLENAVYSSFDNRMGGMNINISRLTAKNARNEQLNNLERTRAIDLAEAIHGEEDIDKAAARVREISSGSSRSSSPMTYLQNIESLLQRGINVRVTGTNAYKRLKFGNSKNNSSQNSSQDSSQDNNSDRPSGNAQIGDLDINEIMSRNEGEKNPSPNGKVSKLITSGAGSLKDAMHALIRGDNESFSASIDSLFGAGLSDALDKVKESKAAKKIKSFIHKDDDKSLVDTIKDKFKSGITSISKAIFGEDGDIDKLKEESIKKAKEVAPGALKGAVFGMSTGGVLGTLVGGPITGALLGTAGHFMTKSETFQKILFGDEISEIDENGNEIKSRAYNGIIDKATHEFMKKNKGILTAGGISGAVIGSMTGGGVLGTLVGGPIAGAFLGTAATAIAKSNAFQKFIFGEKIEDEDGNEKRIGGIMGMFNKAFGNLGGDKTISAQIGGNLSVGAGVGLLASLFTPIGPIGGAALGLAGTMVASKDKFKELLFGKKDENGNRTSKGLLETLGNRMHKEVIAPLAGIAGEALMSAKDAVMDHILDPIMNLAEPLVGLASRLYDKVTEKLDKLTTAVGDGIKKIVGKGFGLLGKGVGFLFKKVFGDKDKGVLGGALKVGSAVTNFVGDKVRSSNERASRKKFFGEKFQNSSAGRRAMEEAHNKWESLSDEEKDKYGNDESKFIKDFGRKFFYNAGDGRDERLKARKERAESRATRKKNSKEAILREKLISELTKGEFGSDSDQAREAALSKLKNTRAYRTGGKFGGVSTDEIEKLLAPSGGRNTDAEIERDKQQLDATKEQTTVLQQAIVGLGDTIVGSINGLGSIIGTALKLPFNAAGKGLNSIGDAIDKKHEEKLERKSIADKAVSEVKNDMENTIVREEHVDPETGEVTTEEKKTNMFRDKEATTGIDLKERKWHLLGIKKLGFGRKLETKLKATLNNEEQGSELYNAARIALDENAKASDRKKAIAEWERLKKEKRTNSWEAARESMGLRKSIVKGRLRSISEGLRNTGGRGYASGTTNAEEGDAVVGENGPEIVRFRGGEKVIPNHNAIDVNIVSVKRGSLQGELEDATVDVNLTGQDGPITTYGTAAKLDENTDNASTIEKALSKKDKLVNYEDIKADNNDDNEKTEKKEKTSFFDMLKGIGSGIADMVKGIIPLAGGIAALYTVFKNPDGVLSLLKNIGSGISGIADFFSGSSNKDAATTGANAVTSIADVQADSLWDYANPMAGLNHNAKDAAGNSITNTSATEVKNEFLYKQALRNQLLGTSTLSSGYNTMRSNMALSSATRWDNAANFMDEHLGGVGSDAMRSRSNKLLDSAEKFEDRANASQNHNAGASILRNAGKVGVTYGISNAAGWGVSTVAEKLGMSEENANTAGNVATMATSGALTVNMIKSAATGKESIVDKVLNGIIKVCKWIGEKIGADKLVKKIGSSKIAKSFETLGKNIASAISKKFDDIVIKKIQTLFAKWGVEVSASAATAGFAIAVGAVAGLASGLCGTEHLFGVLPGQADGVMKTISGILGTVLGALEWSPLGWIVVILDVIDAILIAIPPIKASIGDWEISIGGVGLKQTLARLLYKVFAGKENLEEKQQAFQDERQYYADTYGVSMNDATFNDMVNNTGLLDWAWHGKVKTNEDGHLDYDDAGKVLYRGGIRSLFSGAEHEYTRDADGNIVRNSSGEAVIARDAYGHSIYEDEKWGNKVGNALQNFGSFFTGRDVYQTDENGRAVVDENGEYVVDHHEGGIFSKTRDYVSNKIDETRMLGKAAIGTAKFAWGKADEFIEAIPGIGNLYKGVKAAVGAIPDALNTIKDGVKGVASWVGDKFNGLVEGAKEIGGNIKDWVGEKAEAIKDGVSSAADWVADKLSPVTDAISAVGDWISDKLTKFTDGVMKVDNWIDDKLNNAKDAVVDFAGNTWDGIKTRASNVWNTVTSPFKDAMNVVSSTPSDYEAYMREYMAGAGGKGGGKGITPFYSQKDPRWANMGYEEGGSGTNKETMADAGCGPAAFAMAASGATGRKISPVESASVMQSIGARDKTGTNWKGIGKAASVYGINTNMAISPSESFIDNELDAGKPVVLSGRSGGYGSTPYTSQGHYVVATGKDNKGNYIINDPNSRGGSRKFNKSDIVNETGAAWGFGGRGVSTIVELDSSKTSEGSGTGVMPQDVIGVALNEVGYLEKASSDGLDSKSANSGDANWTKYGRDLSQTSFKHPTHSAWCATFVVWCFWQACNKDIDKTNKVLYGAITAGCANNSNSFKKANRWINGDQAPQAGDIIFYKSSHTGIVTECDGTNFKTCEGNTGGSNDYNRNGGCVYTKSRKVGDSKILGFGRPLYDNNSQFTGVTPYTGNDAILSSSGYTADTSSSSSSSGGFFSKITSFFSELAGRAVDGITTGKWNTDWKGFFGGNNSPDSSGTVTYDSGASSTGVAVPAANINTSSSAKGIYDKLRKEGKFTPAGASGLLGNLYAESGIKTNNLQNSCEKRLGSDDEYTSKVDNGSYSKEQFENDKAGYGLAQWTSAGRKGKLYDLAKSQGKSIADEGVQVTHLINEINTSYKKIGEMLRTTNDIGEASYKVMHDFEAPKSKDSAETKAKREGFARKFYEEFKDNDAGAYGGKGNGITTEGSAMHSAMTGGITTTGVVSSKQNTTDISTVVGYLNNILNVLTQSNVKLDSLDALKSISNNNGFNGTIQQNVFNPSTSVIERPGKTTVSVDKTNESKFNIARKIANGGL